MTDDRHQPPTAHESADRSGAPDVQLASLFDALVEAMIVADQHGRIERFNRAAESLFGYSAREIIGQDLKLLMPPPDRDRHDSYMDNYLRTGERHIIGIGREVEARRKDGSTFTAELAIGEVRWRDSVRFVGMMRDVTERKRAEEQAMRQGAEMIKVSRLMTMGEMAAAMAHELNQPLTAIANYSSASRRLLEAQSGTAEVLDALERINAQAHRAGEVIRRMRGFVKYDDTRREPTPIDAVVDEVLPLMELDAKANNIRLEVEMPATPPEVIVDKIQIQQVLLNLVRNGIDAMAEIGASHRVMRLACVEEPVGEIRLDVVDRGRGVPDSAAGKLFQAFYTTKAAGMGMGLAISRTIVESHGGRLWFSNNRDGGATFSFSLPRRIP